MSVSSTFLLVVACCLEQGCDVITAKIPDRAEPVETAAASHEVLVSRPRS